ncbi:MAG: hypothetical protein JSV56_00620 [Methanomassiliicoccales archaeon]|nr:MAG: hypothetical protein JSV56_00620 [Methanomassiliicoccales archaeon]
MTEAEQDYGDIFVKFSETMTITGTATCKNITLSHDAKLTVENGYLQINGIISMSDNTRFIVKHSTVKLNPPALNDNIHVLHAVDNAMIKVEDDSNLIFNPQPTPTNISYMLLEDYTSFFIINSAFSGDLPSIINQSIEIASVTAGVYLLSGDASWHIVNSDVTGSLSFEGGVLNGRWFWCSLHQRSSVTIDNTDIELTGISSSFIVIKPVSGVTTINNSRILGGTIEGEVTAEIYFENNNFHTKVELRDQTHAKISNCTFQKDLIIGSALSMIGETHITETYVEINNSTFERNLKCEGNSTTSLKESTVRKINVKHNTTIAVVDSIIGERVSVRDNAHAEFMDSPVDSILIDETAHLTFESDQKISVIYLYGSGICNDEITASLKKTQVQDIYINSNFTSSLSFENVLIGNISFYNDINATFECINTSLDNLVRLRSGENVTLNFIIVNSTSPDLSILNINITVRIYYRLFVQVMLNDKPLEAEVELQDDYGSKWGGKSLFGMISFDLLYKFIENETVFINQNYHLKSSFLGFLEMKDVVLTSSKTVIFDWIDIIPPTISNISYEPDQWNQGKEITISANLVDEGVMSISSVTLFYRIDDGDWKEIKMFRIGEDTYRTAIPKQSKKCKISFYISAEDSVENIGISEIQSISIGEEENSLYLSGVVLIICLISVVIIRRAVIYRKIKKYANKYQFIRGKK